MTDNFIDDIMANPFGLLQDGGKIDEVPLDEYLLPVYRTSQELRSERRYDEYMSPLFYFTRHAKAHPRLAPLDDWVALREVENSLLRNGVRWEDFDGIADPEDARDEFIANWHNAKFIPGYSVIENALRIADERPLKFPPSVTPRYGRFLCFAAHLQCLLGENTIFLPCHRTGELMGCSHETIARYQQRARREGYLALEKPHQYGKAGSDKRAAEWRFDLQRFPELNLK